MTEPAETLPRAAVFACAVTCGLMVADLYYAQPLIGTIAPELHLSAAAGGTIVTLTQLGYGAGLFLLVPLADRFENRRLVIATLLLTAAALSGVALARGATSFLLAAMLAGITSTGAQVVIPYAASLAPEARRGRTIGNVMAGLLAGIMLARPVASAVAGLLGWRAIYWITAAAMLAMTLWVRAALPRREPAGDEGYGAILKSMGAIALRTRPLQRRALYQGLVFTAFNIFWTAAPLRLAEHWHYGATGIALFALAGAGGALVAPIAGRWADQGHIPSGTGVALAVLVAATLAAGWFGGLASVLPLAAAAIVLDAATQAHQVLGQRVIYTLPGEGRARLNAIYMTIVFLLGALGSAIATVALHCGGWWGAMGTAAAFAGLALAAFATEFARR